MLERIALNIARNLGNTLNSQENVEIYAYSLRALLMVVINLTLVVTAAYFIKIVPTTLAFLAVFIPFRAFGGGVHLSTFPRCICIGSLLMLGSAYFAAKVSILPLQIALLCLFTLLLALLSIVKWVPASTAKNPIKDPGIIRMQKRNTFIAAVIWAVCVSSSIYFHHDAIALAMIIGAIVSFALITPAGFYIMGAIDREMNKYERGVIIHDA